MLKTVPKLNLTIPDHTILDKIGEGGMSAVYLGRQISLQRKVAIKVLKKLVMDDKTLAERFVNEAKTVASLDHPYIISIYEAKKLPSGLAYFTMPYLTHGDFSEIICTNSDHLIELLSQICEGLSHAHKHGVIHRDLKPENILFDQFGRIKIADFGIAISKNTQRKTKETQLLGSAHYMSPEHIQSKSVDHRSDIYSLGCIIYEKITGDHVFNEKNDFQILMAHINKPVPELPSALSIWQPIIEKCLAKDPEDRFQSVEQVKDALMAIKYHNEGPDNLSQAQPSSSNTFKIPYWAMAAAALLLAVSLTWFFSGPPDEPVTNTNLVAATDENQHDSSHDSQSTESEPLEITVGIVEKPSDEEANDAEMIDLTGNLDNEQINDMSIEVTLNEAQQLLKKFRLTKPKGENAADKFHQVLLEQPENKEAQKGMNQIGVYYFSLINNKLKDNDTIGATKHIESLVGYFEDYNINRKLFAKNIEDIVNKTQQLVNQAVSIRRPDLTTDQFLTMTAMLTGQGETHQQLVQSYNNIPQKGDVSTDINDHAFVFIPVNNQTGIQDFLLGRNEVTVAQFKQFAGDRFTDEKCHHYGKKLFFKKTWIKPPFDQTNQHPVICITYDNAKAYADWLSEQSDAVYRLPTYKEWQYINQQITTSHSCKSANIAGAEVSKESKATDDPLTCQDNHVFTAPIQSFPANTKINDLNGNVAEWITDCNGNTACAAGTSWRSGQGIKNSMTENIPAQQPHSHIGFRLIKELH
jgi:serine/threonine-protein kinase PpkA